MCFSSTCLVLGFILRLPSVIFSNERPNKAGFCCYVALTLSGAASLRVPGLGVPKGRAGRDATLSANSCKESLPLTGALRPA